MQAQMTKQPEITSFDRSYRGLADEVVKVRADLAQAARGCPVAEDLVLLASEFATNAILHGKSGHPNRTFTVRATLYLGEYAWVEVIDQGGPWTADAHDDEHGRGLAVVAAIAGDENWGIDGDETSRVSWFRLDWNEDNS
jgi:serine/threonine-protein kinase RsbW